MFAECYLIRFAWNENARLIYYCQPFVDEAIAMCQHPPKHTLLFQRPQCEVHCPSLLLSLTQLHRRPSCSPVAISIGRRAWRAKTRSQWTRCLSTRSIRSTSSTLRQCRSCQRAHVSFALARTSHSGTTGKPKGVVRDNSGAVILKYVCVGDPIARPSAERRR